jgi:hypothetical protein
MSSVAVLSGFEIQLLVLGPFTIDLVRCWEGCCSFSYISGVSSFRYFRYFSWASCGFFFFTKMGWTFCSFQVLGMWLPIWLFLVRHEAIFCMYGLIADDFMLGIMMDISERTVSEVHSLSWWLSTRREVKEPYCMRNVSSVLLPSKVSAKLPRLPRHPIQNANTS